jgi:hypothetical protein
VEGVFDDLAKPELLGHRDLRRQQRRRLDLAVEQRLEAGAEAAGVHRLDVGQRQVLFQRYGTLKWLPARMPTEIGTSFKSFGSRIFESGRTKIAQGESP